MVDTVATPLPSVVERSVLTTRLTSTFIRGRSVRSVRWNFTPWPAGAGLKTRLTSFPVCKPTPLMETVLAMVR